MAPTASNAASQWAEKRKAQVDAANARKAAKEQGEVTSDHTFKPKIRPGKSGRLSSSGSGKVAPVSKADLIAPVLKRRPGDSVVTPPETPEAAKKAQAGATSLRRSADHTQPSTSKSPAAHERPKRSPVRSTSPTLSSEGESRLPPASKTSGPPRKKVPTRPRTEGAPSTANLSSSSSMHQAASSHTSLPVEGLGSHPIAKAEVRDLTPTSDLPSWPRTPASSIPSPAHGEGSLFCWRDMAAGLGALQEPGSEGVTSDRYDDEGNVQEVQLEGPPSPSSLPLTLAVPDPRKEQVEQLDDELQKRMRLEWMRQHLEEQQRQLEEQALQLQSGRRLDQEDLQRLETHQRQQLQKFDKHQEEEMRQLRPGDTAKAHGDPPFKVMDAAGQELAPAMAPLEPPRTSLCDSLPVISEQPELSLIDEMQQQQMEELQRLQHQWQQEQEQLQQKLQETLRLPEERGHERQVDTDDEESHELPAETCLQLAPSLQEQSDYFEAREQPQQQSQPALEESKGAPTAPDHLDAGSGAADAVQEDGTTEAETMDANQAKERQESFARLDAALVALQQAYRSSYHSAYEQHTSFLDKVSLFDQRCLDLVPPAAELSAMPQEAPSGATFEEGGFSSDMFQLGSLVKKLSEFIGADSSRPEKDVPSPHGPLSPSPQERVILSGGRRWPPGPQVRPGPPASVPDPADQPTSG